MIFSSANGNSITLLGQLVDDQTRCAHYNSDNDIIALKFKCCQTYYPCYKCHDELTNHDIQKYSINSQENVILCGVCKLDMTFDDYKLLVCKCGSAFNPGCKLHYDYYFDK